MCRWCSDQVFGISDGQGGSDCQYSRSSVESILADCLWHLGHSARLTIP